MMMITIIVTTTTTLIKERDIVILLTSQRFDAIKPACLNGDDNYYTASITS